MPSLPWALEGVPSRGRPPAPRAAAAVREEAPARTGARESAEPARARARVRGAAAGLSAAATAAVRARLRGRAGRPPRPGRTRGAAGRPRGAAPSLPPPAPAGPRRVSPRARTPGAARPSLSADPDPRGEGGQARLRTSASGRCPTPSLGHPVSGWKALHVGWKSREKLRHHHGPEWRRESCPPPPLPAPSQLTAPHSYLARERQGGPPSTRPQPSRGCRADTTAGFRDPKGCDSPWGGRGGLHREALGLGRQGGSRGTGELGVRGQSSLFCNSARSRPE